MVALITRLLEEIELFSEMIWLITLSGRERAGWSLCGEEMARQQNGESCRRGAGRQRSPRRDRVSSGVMITYECANAGFLE